MQEQIAQYGPLSRWLEDTEPMHAVEEQQVLFPLLDDRLYLGRRAGDKTALHGEALLPEAGKTVLSRHQAYQDQGGDGQHSKDDR